MNYKYQQYVRVCHCVVGYLVNISINTLYFILIRWFVSDLWFRISESRRARHEQAHDPGGGDAVLQGPGDLDGRETLLGGRRRVVRRLYIRRAPGSQDTIPGAEPRTAVGAHNRITRDSVFGGHEVCLRGRQVTYAEKGAETTFAVGSVHALVSGDAWSRPPVVSDVGVWSRKYWDCQVNIKQFKCGLGVPTAFQDKRQKNYIFFIFSLVLQYVNWLIHWFSDLRNC